MFFAVELKWKNYLNIPKEYKAKITIMEVLKCKMFPHKFRLY